MQIKDITLDDIRQGKNWKVISPESIHWDDVLLEEIPIEECQRFHEEDLIVYSVIFVTDDERVTPLVMLKEAYSAEYGGDYCEFVNGHWRQVGLKPNPNAPLGNEYFANPLDEDESFISDDYDYRKWHRDNFKKYADLLE
jgi:hypothetical protein